MYLLFWMGRGAAILSSAQMTAEDLVFFLWLFSAYIEFFRYISIYKFVHTNGISVVVKVSYFKKFG